MCIIVYKPENEKFPNKKILQNCFDGNPDGAGFMYAINKKVYIEKGLMSFTKFWKKLQEVRKQVGDNIPYVLHFRISTQAGKRNDCTHPFPLSAKMEDLRKLSTTADIGIAHNGIISLTSYGYGYTKQITYNDTMQFITDYLSLIIKDKKYYENKDTLMLIERLCESKLAILDGDGHCQLIGNGWILENGIAYSNNSYLDRAIMFSPSKSKYACDDSDDLCVYKEYGCKYYRGDKVHEGTLDACNYCAYVDDCMMLYDDEDELYDFDPLDCPATEDGDYNYCAMCKNYYNCWDKDTY